MNTEVITNWGGDIRSTPAAIVSPSSAQEIVAVMKDRAGYPSPVRAVGSNHSTTACAAAEGGTVVHMRQMQRILDIDHEAMTVTVEAGALLIDVAKELERHGLQFYVNCEIGCITMGSAATCGTKDASMPGEYGQVNSYTIAMKLVRPDGEIVEITEDDPDLLQAVRSSYGLLGIVFETTFRVKPLQSMRVRHETFRIDEFIERIPEFSAGEESVMYYLGPFLDLVTVEYRSYRGEARGRPRRWLWRVRNLAWKVIGPTYSYWITRLVRPKRVRFMFINAFYRMAHLILDVLMGQRGSIPTDQLIRYPEKAGRAGYTFSIWAFPEDTFAAGLSDYVEFVKDHYAATGFRCDLLNVGYRVLEDRSSLFSYSYDGNVMTADPVSTGAEGWEEFLDAYNVFASEHGGIPLFNQSKRVTRPQIDTAFGDRITVFQTYRDQFDPDQRLVNDFFREALL